MNKKGMNKKGIGRVLGKNKKAAEMTIGTIIIIVLALVVLVVLIFGFTSGWSNLWASITSFGGGKENIQTIVQSCQMACTTNSYYDYCSMKRTLNYGNKQSVSGSCKEFEGVKELALSCGGIECAGVKAGDSKSMTGETKTQPPIILYALAGEELGTIKDEPDIEQRKKDLEIPDKFCYWQEMANMYKEKCQFSDDEIQDIFDKKIYREENTPGWATLNADGDFCVEVVFDYKEWENEKGLLLGSVGGFWNYKKIYLNPYTNWGTKEKTRILFHEGLHSIQSKLTQEASLGSGSEGYSSWDSLDDQSNQMKAKELLSINCDLWRPVKEEVEARYESSYKEAEAELVARNFKDGRLIDLNNDGSVDDDADRYQQEGFKQSDLFSDELEKIRNEYDRLCEFGTTGGLPSTGYLSESYRNFNQILTQRKIELSEESKKLNEDFGKKLEEVNLLYFSVRAKEYIGSKVELDPRLSEVQRWWLDKTTPNCEIIYTSEKAKEVFDKFLVEENIGEYSHVQSELNSLLYIYEKEGKRQEIYDALINRLPGLAQADTPDTGTAYA